MASYHVHIQTQSYSSTHRTHPHKDRNAPDLSTEPRLSQWGLSHLLSCVLSGLLFSLAKRMLSQPVLLNQKTTVKARYHVHTWTPTVLGKHTHKDKEWNVPDLSTGPCLSPRGLSHLLSYVLSGCLFSLVRRKLSQPVILNQKISTAELFKQKCHLAEVPKHVQESSICEKLALACETRTCPKQVERPGISHLQWQPEW